MAKISSVILGVCLILGWVPNVHASIMAQLGTLGFASISHSENFESYAHGTQLANPFSTSSGFNFRMHYGSSGFQVWSPGFVGLSPTKSLFQDGGATSMTSVSLASGADISQISFDVGNIFSLATHNIWIRTYHNGVATGFDFSFRAPATTAITIWSTGATAFDEIRFQTYFDAIQSDERQYGGGAIDNIVVGQAFRPIPEPTAFLVWGMLGLFALGARINKA